MPHPSSKKNEVAPPALRHLLTTIALALRLIGKPLFHVFLGLVFILLFALLISIRLTKIIIKILKFLRLHLPRIIDVAAGHLIYIKPKIQSILSKTRPTVINLKSIILKKGPTTIYPPPRIRLFRFLLSSSKVIFAQASHSLSTFWKTLSLLAGRVKNTLIRIRRSALIIQIKKIPYPPLIFVSLIIAVLVLPASFFWIYIFKDLPPPTALSTHQPALTTRIFDRRGRLLFKFYKSENRTLISFSDIPQIVRQATITIEDKDFYSHQGISLRGVFRALWTNLSSGTLTGGSTITQQLVKNTLLSPEKTWQRKIREMILALRVESRFSKNQILEMYLNEVPYGGSTYGIAEAAETYFGKRVQDLNLAEAAYLAGLPASPTELSPYGSNPQLARSRQKEVLLKMVENRFISQQTANEALSTKLNIRPARTDILAPHFVMYVKDILSRKYGDALVEQGGLQVYTSLDLDIQEMAQKYLTAEIDKDRFLHVTNGAALVTVPQTGEILAMVGSRDYFDTAGDGNVNATLALRQPGSSIKPINYAAALANGFTAATVIPDTPITFQIPGQPPYSPINYDHHFHGNVPLRTALGSSYNVPAVKVLSAIGIFRMIEQGKKMGITTWNDPDRFGLSLTLGGGEVKMVDMATAYGALANLGYRVDLQPILRIDDSRGRVIEKSTCTEANLPNPAPSTTSFAIDLVNIGSPPKTIDCNKQPAVDPKIAFILSNILADNAARTPAFGPHSDLVIPSHYVSVKTGTTNDLKDNWTIGFTSDFLVATWVGNFDGSPMSHVASGITGASPIWNKIMTSLLNSRPDPLIVIPPDIVKTEICSLTGTVSCSACPNNRTEYFLPDTAPTQTCSDTEIQKILVTKHEDEARQKSPPTPSLN